MAFLGATEATLRVSSRYAAMLADDRRPIFATTTICTNFNFFFFHILTECDTIGPGLRSERPHSSDSDVPRALLHRLAEATGRDRNDHLAVRPCLKLLLNQAILLYNRFRGNRTFQPRKSAPPSYLNPANIIVVP